MSPTVIDSGRREPERPGDGRRHSVPLQCLRIDGAGTVLDKTELELDGIDSQGKPFTHIVRRRVQCEGCGQMRIDVTRENRV